MVKVEKFFTLNFAKEFIYGVMDQNMKENGQIIKSRDK